MQFDHKTINLQRFPKTGNKSLRPWSAADELLLKTAITLGLDKKSIVIAHDTFGGYGRCIKCVPTSFDY